MQGGYVPLAGNLVNEHNKIRTMSGSLVLLPGGVASSAEDGAAHSPGGQSLRDADRHGQGQATLFVLKAASSENLSFELPHISNGHYTSK
jgi:hypothetical protein